MFKDTEVVSNREKMAEMLSDLIRTLRDQYTIDHLVSITKVSDSGTTSVILKFKDC